MARPPAEHYELSDSGKRDLIALINIDRTSAKHRKPRP